MKILLVRLRLLGDVVFTTPLVRALRRRSPEAHLTYIVEPTAAPAVRGNPNLNEVIVLPRHSGFRRLRDDISFARTLRRRHFDVAIDLHGGPRGSWLTWASGAPMRIGYRTAGRSWMYTHAVARPEDLSPQHSVLKQWELLAPLGIGACDRSRDAVEMVENVAAVQRVEHMLTQAGVGPNNQLIVLHVSAGNQRSSWISHTVILAADSSSLPDRRMTARHGQ
jgi:ADP-heptose:LPS heptosyltransferase